MMDATVTSLQKNGKDSVMNGVAKLHVQNMVIALNAHIPERQKMNREKELEYALLLMVRQYCSDDNCLYHQHMFAGEEAFRALGITLETPVEEIDDRIEQLESEGY